MILFPFLNEVLTIIDKLSWSIFATNIVKLKYDNHP